METAVGFGWRVDHWEWINQMAGGFMFLFSALVWESQLVNIFEMDFNLYTIMVPLTGGIWEPTSHGFIGHQLLFGDRLVSSQVSFQKISGKRISYRFWWEDEEQKCTSQVGHIFQSPVAFSRRRFMGAPCPHRLSELRRQCLWPLPLSGHCCIGGAAIGGVGDRDADPILTLIPFRQFTTNQSNLLITIANIDHICV
jgi:hypothetical protein